MRLSATLLPALLGAALASFDAASVYFFQKDDVPTSNPPTLTPEQARLVFAQRLGVSQYHELRDDEDTLSYINKFGTKRASLFEDEAAQDEPTELVMIIEGVPRFAESMLKAAAFKPGFMISSPPSVSASKKLTMDLNLQAGEGKECSIEEAVNPFETKCWNGKSKVIHFDLEGKATQTQLMTSIQQRITHWANKGEMNTIVILVPQSSGAVKDNAAPYGSYDLPSQARLGARQAAEEVMTLSDPIPEASVHPESSAFQSNSSSNYTTELPPVPPFCHSSLSSCNNATNGCSGRGECYKKSASCFTCRCSPQNTTFTYGNDGEKRGWTYTYYGGAACQKRDVSAPFWLIATSTVVIIGLVGWAIGMLFSIGEEKLPGVIGAGVSSNRAK